MHKIVPNFWFDQEAEEAANYYCSIFPNSKINNVSHYGEAGPGETGSVLTVDFEINGQSYTALNGGKADFDYTEALSLFVQCESQEEVDDYWAKLTADGGQEGPCGWCKDKYGVSWQIIPDALMKCLSHPDPEKANAAMKAMLKMKKIEIAELERAIEEPASVK